jgi:hypothetical protein
MKSTFLGLPLEMLVPGSVGVHNFVHQKKNNSKTTQISFMVKSYKSNRDLP